MSEVKHTPWFGGNVKPVRIGVYQTMDRDDTKFYNYFDGVSWHWGSSFVSYARQDDPMSAGEKKRLVCRWRGISSATGA